MFWFVSFTWGKHSKHVSGVLLFSWERQLWIGAKRVERPEFNLFTFLMPRHLFRTKIFPFSLDQFFSLGSLFTHFVSHSVLFFTHSFEDLVHLILHFLYKFIPFVPFFYLVSFSSDHCRLAQVEGPACSGQYILNPEFDPQNTYVIRDIRDNYAIKFF